MENSARQGIEDEPQLYSTGVNKSKKWCRTIFSVIVINRVMGQYQANYIKRQTVTAVFMSQNNVDELKQALQTFYKLNTHSYLKKVIVVKNSPHNPKTGQIMLKYPNITWLSLRKSQNKLQEFAALDLAYSLVQSDWILQTEEHWKFTKSGFLEDAIKYMNNHPTVAQVYFTKVTDKVDATSGQIDMNQKGAFSFHPSLKRTKDYKLLNNGYSGVIANSSEVISEGGNNLQKVAKHYKKLGYSVSQLPQAYCQEIA